MNEMIEIIEANKKNKMQIIPEHTLGALLRYKNEGIAPGGFLISVLSNDLKESFSRADDLNIANMFAVVRYIYNEMPACSWGSLENVENWINKFKNK
jgi:hypothetical protein